MTDSPKLGVNHDVISVDTNAALHSHMVNMVTQAIKTIDITSRKMDARLTNHTDFIDAIRSCVAKNPNFKLRILIYQLEEFLTQNHQILELSRKLSSCLSIKVINKDQQHFNHCYILVDNDGVIYQEESDRYESIVEYTNKQKNRKLTRQFNEAWEHGVRDSNLYSLDI